MKIKSFILTALLCAFAVMLLVSCEKEKCEYGHVIIHANAWTALNPDYTKANVTIIDDSTISFKLPVGLKSHEIFYSNVTFITFDGYVMVLSNESIHRKSIEVTCGTTDY